MNNLPKSMQRQLKGIHDRLETLRDELETAHADTLKPLMEEAQDRLQIMSDKVRESTRGLALAEKVDNLEEASSKIENAINSIYDAVVGLSELFEEE